MPIHMLLHSVLLTVIQACKREEAGVKANDDFVFQFSSSNEKLVLCTKKTCGSKEGSVHGTCKQLRALGHPTKEKE